jgi:hypothetical protein
VKFVNFGVELIENDAKGSRHPIVVGEQRSPVRTKDPDIELGMEEGDFKAVGGGRIAGVFGMR